MAFARGIMQDLLQTALAEIHQGDKEKGMSELKRLCDEGIGLACICYGDILFKQNAKEGLCFLRSKSEHGVKGTALKYLTLSVFFSQQGLNEVDLNLLHDEAVAGHLESAIVLLHLSVNTEYEGYFARLVNQRAPKLLSKLSYYARDKNPQCDDIAQALTKLAEKWNNFAFDKPIVSDDAIELNVIPNVISPLACHYIVERLDGLVVPSMVHDPITGEGKLDAIRTSKIVHIVPELLDWFTLEIELRISQFTQTPRCNGEYLNLLSYEREQEYKPHYDAIVGDGPQFERLLEDGGQRQKTAICCLQQAELGGETLFPKRRLSINCPKGGLLVFNNLQHDGSVLRDSYHAGSPVLEGRKWILTKWIREQSTIYGKLVYS